MDNDFPTVMANGGGKTFLSGFVKGMNKYSQAIKIYKEYCNHGQKKVFDIGFRYMGMGHIEIISCDLESHLLFFHPGGGSNGWDRESNFNEIVKNGPQKYNQFFFSNWFYKINLENNIC